jgi:hypothetical protein
MSTGYTSYIKDGISFEDFALKCAFGACIEMKDESFDKEIPQEFKPSQYNKNKIVEIEEDMKKLKLLSNSELQKKAKEEYRKEKNRLNKNINESLKLEFEYKIMLKKCTDWEPPTDEHKNLKSFMIDQIIESVKFDCNIKYYIEELNALKLLSGKEYFNKKNAELVKSLEYHKKQNIEEINRTTKRNKWLKQLRDSL